MSDAANAPLRIARAIAALGVVALVGLALLVMVDVVLRWLFAAPIDGVAEISKLIIAMVVASFFPAALAERQHIAIEFVGKSLGPRAKATLEAFGALVTFGFFAAVAWRFVLYTAELGRSGETTWILGWPIAPWWVVVTVFIVFCVPVQAIVLARIVRNRRQPGEDAA